MATPVKDPRLIAQLNDRLLAQQQGIDYDRVSRTREYQDAFRKFGSGFRIQQDRDHGGFLQGVANGLGDVVMGGSQLIAHGLNKVGLQSDDQVNYYDATAKAREAQLDGSSTLGRIAGNLLVPIPGTGKVKALGGLKGIVAEGALQGAGAAALQPTVGDNFASDKMGQLTTGAIFGGAANGALNKVAGLAGRGAAPGKFEQVLGAGERQGIHLGLAEASPRAVTRAIADTSSNLPGGGTLVRQGLTNANLFEQRAATAADLVGQVKGRSDLGEGVKQGVNKWVGNFKERSEDLYNTVTRLVPMDAKVGMGKTVAAMQETARNFPSVPGLGEELANSRLMRMASKLSDGQGNAKELFFNEAQRLRSEIGSMLGEPAMVGDIPRRELAKVYAALSDDMAATLSKTPEAAKAFKNATNYYKAGRNRINNVLEPLISNTTDERVADKVVRMVKEDAKGVRALRRSLAPGEWDDVAASVFGKLGEVGPGLQNATGHGFGIPEFLTDFNKLRNNPKAFEFAFGGTRYAKLRDTYGDLATIADSIKQSRKMANISRSGHTAGLIGLGTLVITAPAVAAKAVGGNMVLSRMLASPKFARWLLKTGKIANRGLSGTGHGAEALMKAHLERLPAIAAAESPIADGIASLYSFLDSGGQ